MMRLQGQFRVKTYAGGWRLVGLVLAILLASGHTGMFGQVFQWSNVKIGGGGYFTGIILHPANPDLLYARTDNGGAYRWNAATNAWVPITDMYPLSSADLYGIESFAIDPAHTNTIYLAQGLASSDITGIYKSTDQGATWQGPLNPFVPLGPNDFFKGLTSRCSPFVRQAGERLMVDPNNSNVLYFGTRGDGLWRSSNAGTNWTQVASLATNNYGQEGYGITFVAFDPTSGTPGSGSSNIYLGVFGSTATGTDGGVYWSTNAGASWSKMTNPAGGSVNQPMRGQCSSVDGSFWVTHQHGVARAAHGAAVLTDVTPAQKPKSPYCALALDPADPAKAVAGSYKEGALNPIYRSTNGGADWIEVSATHHSTVPWTRADSFAAATSAFALNPAKPTQLWFGDWSGAWKTEDYTATNATWTNAVSGDEQTAHFSLISPPAPSAELLSGCQDSSGYRHTDVDAYPKSNFGYGYESYGLDYCANNPNFIVRAAGNKDDGFSMSICVSANNGQKWTKCLGWSNSFVRILRVAVSSSNADNFLAEPTSNPLQVTTNGGDTFTACAGIAEIGPASQYNLGQPMAADPVKGSVFYYYVTNKLYQSTDGGVSFTAVNTGLLQDASMPNLKARPGVSGDLWLSLEAKGLWRSTDGGTNFTEVRSPLGARMNVALIAFGKPASGTLPWLYAYANIDGVEGMQLSTNLGTRWTRISTAATAVGNKVHCLSASQQIAGRVYVGTGGRGIYYGQLVATETQLTTNYWDGSASASWSTLANWNAASDGASTNPASYNGPTTVACFNTTGVTAAQTVNWDVAAYNTLAGMVFNSPGAVTLTNSGGANETFVIDAAGLAINQGAGAVTFAGAIGHYLNVALAANQTWVNNSAQTLSVKYAPGGVVNLGANTLTIDGSGTIAIGFAITGPSLGGSGAVVKNGSGLLTLGGPATNAGGLTLNSGTVSLSTNSAAGTGPLTLNGGWLYLNGAPGTSAITNSVTINGAVSLGSATKYPMTFGAPGTTTLADNSTLVNSNLVTIGQVIEDDDLGYGLTQAGPSNLVLTAANTYSGATLISAGKLVLGAGGSVNNSTNLLIASGATFDVSAISSFTLSSSTSLEASGVRGAPATIKGGTSVSLGSQAVTLDYTPVTFSGDRTSPALTLSQGNVILNGPITLYNGGSAPLGVGIYTLITNLSGTIAGSPTLVGTSGPGGTGLAAGTTASLDLTTPGQVNLVVQTNAPPPRLTGISVAGATNILLNGTGGPTNQLRYYWVRSATNLTLPLSNWSVLTTNPFNADGTFSNRLPVTPGVPRQFYRLQLP